jgi:serine/threonine-protein kinase
VSAWQVEGELGRGGMSSVHAVVHTQFGKRAAIKIAHRAVLGSGMTPQTFLREARIVHRVDHAALIDVFAIGSFDRRPYLVMEKLIGTPLGRRVDHSPLPRREAIEILLELCDVLRAAHAAGIVHRDLKLDNVCLCDTPFAGGRRVKLLDWGVAHVEGEEDAFRGLIAGTLTYVAPEQIRGDGLTGAADIYSLAVLAYHLLCRRPPFAGSELALLHMHLRVEPPAPSTTWPEIPRALEQLLVRMLAKHPEQRPALAEVEATLRAALASIEHESSLAEGSKPNIPLPAEQQACPRPPLGPAAPAVRADVLGRPLVRVWPRALGWLCVAIAIVVLAGVIRAFA